MAPRGMGTGLGPKNRPPPSLIIYFLVITVLPGPPSVMLEGVGGWSRRRRGKVHMITSAQRGWGWGAGSMTVDLTTSAFQSVCGQVCVTGLGFFFF